jgi:hypothetical protein
MMPCAMVISANEYTDRRDLNQIQRDLSTAKALSDVALGSLPDAGSAER